MLSARLLLALWFVVASARADGPDALTLLRAGDLEAAAPAVRAEALAHPTDLDRQERWIDLLLSIGLPETLSAHYRQRVRTDPRNPDAHYLLGRALPDAAGSVAAYEAALKLNPSHARAWMGLGAVHRAKGELREAGDAYRRALTGDPSLAEAWGGLLAVFLAAEDREGAEVVAAEAVQRVPTLSEGWLVLAAGDPAQARAVLDRGIGFAPWDGRLYEARAALLLTGGDGVAALADARRALAIDPALRGARVTSLTARDLASGALAASALPSLQAARSAGDAAASLKLLDQLVARYPNAVAPRLDRAHVRIAPDPAGALSDLQSAQRVAPDDDEIVASLGLLLARQGRAAEAVPLLERAVAQRPVDRSLALALVKAQAQAGDLGSAIASGRALVDHFPSFLEGGVVYVELMARSGRTTEAYLEARSLAQRIPDPRAELAAGAAAVAAERWLDAAEHYDAVAKRTGKTEFAATAVRLRARASTAP